jgi:hypothetical protein
MNSYATHDDVAALEFCCYRWKNSSGTPLGIAERALNDPRNLTSTNSDTQKQHEK